MKLILYNLVINFNAKFIIVSLDINIYIYIPNKLEILLICIDNIKFQNLPSLFYFKLIIFIEFLISN